MSKAQKRRSAVICCKSTEMGVPCVALAHALGNGRCVVHAFSSAATHLPNAERAKTLSVAAIEPPLSFSLPWLDDPHWTERYE